MIKKITVLVFLGFVAIVAFWRDGTRAAIFSKGTTIETKGWEIAEREGCFNCHGPMGKGKVPNPGTKGIPGFQNFTFMMSIHSEAELEAWIMEGAPSRLREKSEYQAGLEKRAVVMPAYSGRLTPYELEAVKAFFVGVSGVVFPPKGPAEEGFKVAQRAGCFGCHGPSGRLDVPNIGSFVGRIPAWNGPDYPELVRDELELRQWILDGAPARIISNPMAQFFTNRAALKMPGYKGLITDVEVEHLMAYIQWLRDPSQPGHEPKYGEAEDLLFNY